MITIEVGPGDTAEIISQRYPDVFDWRDGTLVKRAGIGDVSVVRAQEDLYRISDWLSYWDAEQVARESKDEAAIASVKAHKDFKLNGSQWVAQVFRPCLKCGHNVMPDAINYHYCRCEHCDHRVDFSKGSA